MTESLTKHKMKFFKKKQKMNLDLMFGRLMDKYIIMMRPQKKFIKKVYFH